MDDTVLSFTGQNNVWNSARDAEPVVLAIKNHKVLKCLKLEGNTLGVEAAEAIGEALSSHSEFERAHWKDLFTSRLKTEIPEALRHLFQGLIKAKAKLIELDLSDNALGPICVEGMADFIKSPLCYSLQELRLNNNGLGIKGGTMLAGALMELVDNAKKAGSPLKLKVFVAGRNRLEVEGARVFATFFASVGTLKEIAMPQNGISHEGIAALAAAFSKNKHLNTINLNDNTFTSKGARAMAEYLPALSRLEVINFGDCLVETLGAIHIAKALQEGHTNLRELYLDSNEITAKGGMAVVESMKNKEKLELLNLDCNQFGEEGVEKIKAKMKESGKLAALGSLEDDEEPGDETEEDKETDVEREEESVEEENEIEEAEDSSILDTSSQTVGITPSENETVIKPAKGTITEFLGQPSAAGLLGLGNSAPSQMVEEARKRSSAAEDNQHEALISSCFWLLMKTASLAVIANREVKDLVDTCCVDLAREAFERAEEHNLVSLATNSLLVHLGFIKCEDKKFRIDWDLRGCLLALANVVAQPFFPKESKKAFIHFLQSYSHHPLEKGRLMQALFV